MNVLKGDRVLIINSEGYNNITGCHGTVIEVRQEFYPASCIVVLDIDGSSNWVYLKNLEVLPPNDSFFHHGDLVTIKNPYEGTRYHMARNNLVGKIGKIVGWDSRDWLYYLDLSDDRCWFPLRSLELVNYEGIFFYPGDTVIYQEEKSIIQEIKRTKLGMGQLLKIKNQWVPSSEVVANCQGTKS